MERESIEQHFLVTSNSNEQNPLPVWFHKQLLCIPYGKLASYPDLPRLLSLASDKAWGGLGTRLTASSTEQS